MIIDLILDRKDDNTICKDNGDIVEYNSHDFYIMVMGYGDIGNKITHAMDEGTETDVKNALVDYIRDNGYSLDLIDYINSVDWL